MIAAEPEGKVICEFAPDTLTCSPVEGDQALLKLMGVPPRVIPVVALTDGAANRTAVACEYDRVVLICTCALFD